jgi:hypothetical protein
VALQNFWVTLQNKYFQSLLIHNDLRPEIRGLFFVLQNFLRVTLCYETGKNSPPYAFFCPKIWKIDGGGKFVAIKLYGLKNSI